MIISIGDWVLWSAFFEASNRLRRRARIIDWGNDFSGEGISARRRLAYDLWMIDEIAIRAHYEAIKERLDERGRRLFVAAEKIAAGYGGTAAVSRARCGLARP